jgi:hypothetical protein
VIAIFVCGSEFVETGGTRCDRKVKPRGKRPARCAKQAQEADDAQEREHYQRLRDAWTTLAKRCEPFNFPDVTQSQSQK